MFGATGFLGRSLVAALTEAGGAVTVVGRPGSTSEAGSIPFTLGQGEPRPRPGPHDAAVFLAQSSAYADGLAAAPDVFAVNVVGLAEALEIARDAGVSRFLNASSGSVYPLADHPHSERSPADANGIYARSKQFAETLLGEWSDEFSTLSLRFFALYGPGQVAKMVPGLADRIRRGDPVVLDRRDETDVDPGGFRTSPCFVGDATAAVVALLEQDRCGVLNVAGAEALNIREMATEIGQVIGREPHFEVSSRFRTGDLVADVSELRRLTGLPSVPFLQGLRETFGGDSCG